MINKITQKLLTSQLTIIRRFSYKPIRRPQQFGAEKQDKQKDNNEIRTPPSLSEHLRARIKATGPITVADYMKEVLTNPASGYYMSKDVFGEKGDFITSPEIGQIFGELVAVWLYSEWQKLGAPKPFQLVELGPGRGTLSQDIIRALSQLGITNNMSLHLVEISPHLSQLQARRLCCQYRDVDFSDQNLLHYRQGETLSGIPVRWYRKIEDVPAEFSIILAHEFFDALPIHKFQKDENKWREVLIDINQNKNDAKEEFRFVMSRSETAMLRIFLKNLTATEQRQHIEYSLETVQIMEHIVDRLETNGGFGLIMDYGHFGENTDTFRAFKSHQLHDPLVHPGTADLTADVDFKLLKHIVEQNDRLVSFGPVKQKDFLQKLGGDVRLEMLIANSPKNQIDQLKSGYEMLTDTMGDRFKFFSIFPSVLKEHLRKFPVNGFF